MHDLRVWADVEADGSSPTTTPGKLSGKEDEMGRLAKVRAGQILTSISASKEFGFHSMLTRADIDVQKL